MKYDESLAKKYLTSLNIGNVIYEPDGNIPPDFLMDGRIAIEVRRLNKHYKSGGKLRGMEQDMIPVCQGVENLLSEFKMSDAPTWLVWFTIQRPITEWPKLRRKLRVALKSIISHRIEAVWEKEIDMGFTISVAPAVRVDDRNFHVAGYSDSNAGGFVVQEIVASLSAYINEKKTKTRDHLNRYPEWWLLFVDHIGRDRESSEVKKHISRSDPWAKILILNPSSGRAYEI